ncbi:MAG: hypothetical protein WD847_07920 [Pirellulales bacterium]
MTRGPALAACICLASALAGCAGFKPREAEIHPDVVESDGLYRSALVSYQVDAGGVNPSNAAGYQVSFQAPPPVSQAPARRLSIQYPHPRGLAGLALAEVVFESAAPEPAADGTSAWRRWMAAADRVARNTLPGVQWADGVEEAWALDIPRSDLDRVLAGLFEAGYFNRRPGTTGEVDLSATVDGALLNQRWGRVDELDALIERVRQEGQLVSYTRAPRSRSTESAGPTVPYRALIQSE